MKIVNIEKNPKNVYHKRPLEREQCATSVVEIIVPFHGQYDKLGRLISSVYRGTSSNPFRLTIVDDGSPNNGFIKQLEREAEKEKIKNLSLIRIDQQRGFGAALWEGFSRTEFPYICFLNSDCVVEDVNWLKALHTSYMQLAGQGVKFLSARMDNPTTGDPRVRGSRSEKPRDIIIDVDSINQIIDNDKYLPLTATFCHRDLFKRIGPIKSYPFGMYEDIELACRLFSYGYKQAISGASWIHHEGGATFRSLARNAVAQEEINENFSRCCQDIKLLKK